MNIATLHQLNAAYRQAVDEWVAQDEEFKRDTEAERKEKSQGEFPD